MFLFFWFDLQYIRFSFFFGVVSNFFFSSVPSNYKHQRKKKGKAKLKAKKQKLIILKKRKENWLQFIRISSGQKLWKISSQEWGPKDPRVSEAQSKQ